MPRPPSVDPKAPTTLDWGVDADADVDAALWASDDRGADRNAVGDALNALLRAHSESLPVGAALSPFAARLEEDEYTALLNALTPHRLWDLADAVVDWVRHHTRCNLPGRAVASVARNRVELAGDYDAAVRALDWTRMYGFHASGELVEMVCQLWKHQREHVRDLATLDHVAAYVRTTDAGRALWDAYSDEAYWRRGGVVVNAEVYAKSNAQDLADLLSPGEIDVQPPEPGGKVIRGVPINKAATAYSDLDLIIRQKRRAKEERARQAQTKAAGGGASRAGGRPAPST